MDLLQSNGFWEDLVDSGGSREYILSMPASEIPLETMDSSDVRNLDKELNEYVGADAKGHRELRSSLSSIPSQGLIRSLSTYTDSGRLYET